MGRTTAAKKYVAIDCHDATLVFEAISENGDVEIRGTVPTRAEAIRNALVGLKAPLEIVFEEGILAQWLYETLGPLGRCVVCDPRSTKRRGNKSDRRDTHEMALALRRGDLRTVFHDRGTVGALKEYVRAYQSLVADSTRTMLRIKSIYRARAIRCRGKEVYSSERRRDWLCQLDVPAKLRADLLYEELDQLRPLRQRAKSAMMREASKQPAYKHLVTVPFLGPVRASLLLATLITPWRFRTKRQLWGYAGLAVVTSSSADQDVRDGKLVRKPRRPMTRGLNKNHNATVKEVFMAAAHDASCRDSIFKKFYEARVASGMRPEMAQLTLARKLAAVVLSMWKKGVPFDPALIDLTA